MQISTQVSWILKVALDIIYNTRVVYRNNLQHLSVKSVGWSAWVLGVTLEYLKLQANSRRKSKQAKGTRNMNKINSKLSDNKNDART